MFLLYSAYLTIEVAQTTTQKIALALLSSAMHGKDSFNLYFAETDAATVQDMDISAPSAMSIQQQLVAKHAM